MKNKMIQSSRFTAALLLILCLLIINVPVFRIVASADETGQKAYSSGHFYYEPHEGYVSITGYSGKETKVTIPSSITGKPVSEICGGAFDGCSTIRTIVVPDTVLFVADNSFTGCRTLENIITYTVGVIITAGEGVHIEYVNDPDLAEALKETEKTSENGEGSSDSAKAPAGGREGLTTAPDLPPGTEVGDFAYEDNSTPGGEQKSGNGGSVQPKTGKSSAPAGNGASGGSGQSTSGTETEKTSPAAENGQGKTSDQAGEVSASGQPSSEKEAETAEDSNTAGNDITASGNGVSSGQASDGNASAKGTEGTADGGNAGNGSAAVIIAIVICVIAAAFFVRRRRGGKEEQS